MPRSGRTGFGIRNSEFPAAIMLIFDQLKKNDPRLRFVALGVLTGVLTLVAGLWYHQVMSARHYAETNRRSAKRS